MFDAQILMATSTSTYSVLGPWMARAGDHLIASVDVVELGGSPTLQVQMFTKAHEDAGEGSNADTGVTINASTAGPHSDEWDGTLKDMVRYKYTFIPDAAGDWMAFRILPPVWFDGV